MFYKDAYHQYQMSGKGGVADTFDIIYAKSEGSFGEKKGCKKRFSVDVENRSDLTSIKKQNRQAGKWFLWHPEHGKFDIHACGVVAFNGHFIDHTF